MRLENGCFALARAMLADGVVPTSALAPEIDAVVAVALATCAGALAVGAPLEAGTACAIVLVSLALFGRAARGALHPRLLAMVSALAFVVGIVRANAVVRAFESRRAAVVDGGHWPSRCVLRGVVVHSPVRLGDALRIDVRADEATCEGGAFVGTTTLHVPSAEAPPLARGDQVVATAQLAPTYRFWNDGTGDPRPTNARKGVLLSGGADDVRIVVEGAGVAHAIDRARDRVRGRILATFPTDTASMARALVLGEDDLPGDDQRAFRRSGLSHLLAVSGMHLVLVVATFVMALRAILVRIPALAVRVDVLRLASALGIVGAWIYADLAGASGSAIRAAWMMSAGLLACVVARRHDTWRALGLSLLGMVLVDPLVPYDLSFVLSAAATGGLLALGPRFVTALAGALPSRLAFVARPVAATAAASIACAPILACMTADLPLAGLFANLIAVPLGEAAALPLCLVHAVLAPLPLAEHGSALAASGALLLVRAVARGCAGLPWGTLPVPAPTAWQLAAMAVGAFGGAGLATRRPRAWVLAAASAILATEVAVRLRGAPTGSLRVTFMDVGQGDAALVDLPDGHAILIDGGGLVGSPIDTGDRVIAPVLRTRRRHVIDVAVLSHPHPDHFAGLRTGLDAVALGALWDTGQGEDEGTAGAYAALLARSRARGTRIVRPAEICGSHPMGGAIIDVLAPCPGPNMDRGPNDNSLVLRIRYGDRAVLFVGDAEREEEGELVASRASLLRADVLKVGHHGSRTSSSRPFLEAVAPRVAVVSCGVRNRFGHPHPTTVAALAQTGAQVLRTDRDGSVIVTTDGRSLDVTTAPQRALIWSPW